MSKRTWQYALKVFVALSLFVSVLSGCGAPSVKDTYPLESVSGSGNSTSYVYRAAGKTVPEVAEELKEQRTPEQMSPQSNERMFLVYSDEWYHLQQDPAKKEDTLIEIDSKKYVEQNYSSSFLKGYLTATVLDALFDSLRGSGSYRGYSSRDVYRPSQGQYRAPTVQEKRRFRRLRWSGKVRLPVEGRTRILALDQAEVCSTEGPAVHRAEARFHVTGATAAVPAYLIRRVNLIVSPNT